MLAVVKRLLLMLEKKNYTNSKCFVSKNVGGTTLIPSVLAQKTCGAFNIINKKKTWSERRRDGFDIATRYQTRQTFVSTAVLYLCNDSRHLAGYPTRLGQETTILQ